jgi:hypothetical protein
MTMNEYNDPNADFNGIINNAFTPRPHTNPQVTPGQTYTSPTDFYTDTHTGTHGPYGPPPAHQQRPVKTGLTPRGKAALAIAATICAGGGLLGYQHYAAAQAANQVKAQELQIEQQKLALEQQKALDKATQTAQKTQTVADANRQKKIDACVENNRGLVGKQLGATLSSVIDDCQKQYPATTNTGDMQEAATASTTGGSGNATDILLVGGAALALGVGVAVRRAPPPPPAPVYTGYPTH